MNEKFHLGLDIGCGTGQSAIALADYCDKVYAIDPSKDMLDNAISHPNITYALSQRKTLTFDENSFDIVTFAGSLNYAKSKQLADEVVSLCRNGAIVFIYDFEVLLDDVLAQLQLENVQIGKYNYEENFSGLSNTALDLVFKTQEKTYFQITASNLAHLVLSVKSYYFFFRNKFSTNQIHRILTDRLVEVFDSKEFELGANLFYSRYQVIKK